MKKLLTLLTLALIANFSISQIVFQSDLSSWDISGVPADLFGTKTSVSASNVTQVSSGAMYGTAFANIINASTSHKRLTTHAITVVPGDKYIIKMWAATVPNDTTNLRVSLYDLTNSNYGTYTSYQEVIGTSVTMYVDSVVAPAGCTSLEFILSFRNTDALGFGLDSISITGPNMPPTLSQIDLPVTFEDTTVDYTMTDFGGNASALIVDPTNASNHVMQAIKTTGAQTWAGTTVGTSSGFATAIPFTATDQTMSVRVWSSVSGKPVRLKVEDVADGSHTCEAEALTTMNGGWDTLVFDFGTPATGTASLNLTYTFDKASIFFDFGTAGAQDTFYFDDVMFLASPPAALSQIDLPVTFEDTTVDYTMTDFGGNASALIVDPTNASNHVMQVIKTSGAQTWAGTTIGTPSGFATAIPFTTTDQTMSVRVWSSVSGKPVRLKVEDAAVATHTCEAEVLTTMNGGWDTLVFDFGTPATGTAALNLTYTYDKASIFFDFNTAGAQDTFYFDDVMFGGVVVPPPPPTLSQIDLPVTFEDTTVDYTMTDFGGNASALKVDPTNASNHVMQAIKTSGAQTWAGTTIGTPSGLATAIPFSTTDQTMSVRVWSSVSGKPVRLKVEDVADGSHTCEAEALTTMNGGWDTLVFDFGTPATGTAALNLTYTFDKASIFFDFGTAGAQDTFYFDDVMFLASPPAALSQIDLPVTFEDTIVDYTMTDFGGNASALIVDPTNASNHVMQAIKTSGAQTWAGTTIGTPSGLATAIPFSTTDQTMSVRVWSSVSGKPVRLKVEDAAVATHTCEAEVLTTMNGGWDTLVFDFGTPATGTAALNLTYTYDKASIFFDFNTAGAQDTFYFDDVMFGGVVVPPPPPTLSQIDLPVTFEDTTVDYTMTDFGGDTSFWIVDPTNSSNKVMQAIKRTGAQTWAGTTIGTPSGFATAIPFTTTDKVMSARVWSPASGKVVRLKVEDATDPTKSCETDAMTTMNGGWDTLVFDFSNQATGTAALNLAYTFDKASIFFDFGTAGAQDTFYFDDVMFGGTPPPPPPSLTQIDLPVTFEDTTVDYTMTDFGGDTSFWIVDPTNSSNKVMQAIKRTGAQTWAGTTIGTPSGFATAIPFTTTDKVMSARVWSPASGKVVRLKVEDATDPTKSCETDAMTTMNGGWDTLVFDFSNQATGTAALNLAYTFDKASIFFDFGTAGAQDTFYFDDVMFGGTPPPPPPSLTQIDVPVTFEDTTVDYTMTDFGGNASTLVVDPANATNHAMKVEKTAGAQSWAGTTISTSAGFATTLPFSATSTVMNIRVWSPDSNTVIRLKIEDATDDMHKCETESSTTLNGGWEVLNFDFSNHVTGTDPLDLTYTFDMASIFFDFGNAGSGKVYYFDDVMFGGNYAGTKELVKENLSVYPNPTSSQWTISSKDNVIETIEIFNVQGALVFTTNPRTKSFIVNASNYDSGVYIMRATTNQGITTERLVKK